MLKESYVIAGFWRREKILVFKDQFEKYPTQFQIEGVLKGASSNVDYVQVEKRYSLEQENPPVPKRVIIVVAKQQWVAWNYLRGYFNLKVTHEEWVMESDTCKYIALGEDERVIRGGKFDEAWINGDVSYGFVEHIIKPTLPSYEALRLYIM